MKKLFLAFALVACFAVSALSQGAPPWTIQEVDGSPRVNSPTLIKVTNGTLSCTGKTCTITISGGGGGSPGGSSTQVQYNAAGSFGGISGFTSDGTNVTAGSGNLRATRPRFITSIDDTNGNEVFVITATGSAVNEFTITNAATGTGPSLSTSGVDPNIDMYLIPKGSGSIYFGSATTNSWARPGIGFVAVGSERFWAQNGAGNNLVILDSTTGLRFTTGMLVGWVSSATNATGTIVTSLARAADAVIRVTGTGTAAGSLIIGTSAGAIGTSGAGVLAFTLSTEPSTSPTDTTQLYYKDFAAGDGRLYLRNEASAAGSPVANLGDAQTFTGRITFSPGATIAGINVGSLAGDPSTPSNGDLWYDSSSNELTARINGANVALGSGGGSGITIGTTTITSGTSTRVLYNNSGVVGEYTITGTGNVVMSAAPTLTGRVSAADGLFATSVTTGTGSSAGLQVTADSLTTGNGAEISSSSVSSGSVVSIAATGTAAASNTKTGLLVSTSGANGTSTQTTYGARVSNTSTGTSSTNIGLQANASGGSTNFAIQVNNGISWSSGSIALFANTSQVVTADSSNFFVNAGFGLAGGSTRLRSAASGNLTLGAADAASPIAQTLAVQNVSGGTSNTAGASFTIAGSRGTGTGAGGDIIFQTAPAGGSGTTQNALVTTFTIQDDGAVQLKSVTFANLPTVANGYLIYCSDCTIASPCASGGSGALAKGINGAWVCN